MIEQFKKALPVGIIWIVFGLAYSLVERGLLGNTDIYPTTGNPYNFKLNFVVTLVSTFLLGIIFSFLERNTFRNLFATKSFYPRTILKGLVYLCIAVVFLVSNTIIVNSISNGFGDLWTTITNFVFSFGFLSIILYIFLALFVSIIFIEVTHFVDIDAFEHFLTGKYGTSVVEERAFMFIDLKGSTQVAESIGHEKYFRMLKDYFSIVNQCLLAFNFSIYQYVGDEIVVTWRLIDKNNDDFFKLFKMIQANIQDSKHHFLDKYGYVPDIKSAVHCGQVSTGEIGETKKALIFTGDVLNTTSRIEGLCNTLQAPILISHAIKTRVDFSADIQIINMGEHQVKGKFEKLSLYQLL